jgi:LacI family transcriptional regulator
VTGSGIAGVARMAGVSIATVSHVLNDSKYVSPPLRRRVERAVRTLGYRPDRLASALRRGRLPVIGLLVSDITNPFYTELARAIEDQAAAVGYHVLLGNTDESLRKQEAYVDVFLSFHAAGLIVAPVGEQAGSLARLARDGVPAVFVNRELAGVAVPVVRSDNALGAYLATMHLLQTGHERVALIRPDWTTSTITERTDGYRRALAVFGRPFEPDLVWTGSARPDAALRLTEAVLDRRPRPTAIFALSSAMVEGVLEAFRRRAVACPHDVGLVVYNDQRLAEFVAPPLTCVSQPTREMGRVAVVQLVAMLQGSGLDAPAALAPKLIVRASCGCVDEGPGPGDRSDAPATDRKEET